MPPGWYGGPTPHGALGGRQASAACGQPMVPPGPHSRQQVVRRLAGLLAIRHTGDAVALPIVEAVHSYQRSWRYHQIHASLQTLATQGRSFSDRGQRLSRYRLSRPRERSTAMAMRWRMSAASSPSLVKRHPR